MSENYDTIERVHDIRPPYPWFGSKRRIAAVIWQAFGAVDNFIDPFLGSMAVLAVVVKFLLHQHARKTALHQRFIMPPGRRIELPKRESNASFSVIE